MVTRVIQKATYLYAVDDFKVEAIFNPLAKTVSLVTNQGQNNIKTNNLQRNYIDAMAEIFRRITDDFDMLTDVQCYPKTIA